MSGKKESGMFGYPDSNPTRYPRGPVHVSNHGVQDETKTLEGIGILLMIPSVFQPPLERTENHLRLSCSSHSENYS